MTQSRFEIGTYRPIYLWGGPGTIRMNRVKFMDQKVNEFAHHEVHTLDGAKKVVDEVYSNWIHLMYDWGFPPEIEAEDWRDFKKGCAAYHELGVKVFAYIQTSNCVYQGSFKEKDWYAVDAKGRKVFYYTQRYMANLLHPEWQQHIKTLITQAIEFGADGIFFDNLWDGAMPVSLMGTWLGSAGSFDAISQQKYTEDTGKMIPFDVAEDRPEVREYLNWRVAKVTSVVGSFAQHARELKPDVVIGANDFDMVMRNSPVIYGLNLEQQAQVQDITMIENFAIPKWVPEKDVLVNNAQTIRVARALVGNAAHLSVLSYDDGIGWDGMYHPRRFRQTIAEAAACGVTNTIKGTEYHHAGQHTMLTANGFEVQRGAIGHYQQWLETNTSLFSGKRQNLADVVLFYPVEELMFRWQEMAPLFFAVGQTLLKLGIPWRVVRKVENIGDSTTVYVFTQEHLKQVDGATLVTDIPGWSTLVKSSVMNHNKVLRRLTEGVIEPLWHSYFSSKLMRSLIDGLRLFKLFTGTKLFNLPPYELQKSLRDQTKTKLPKVVCDGTVLIEFWKKDDEIQIHLMNYTNELQRVTIEFGKEVQMEILSPDDEMVHDLKAEGLSFDLDVYTILKMKE